MAEGPSIAKTPLELLTRPAVVEPPLLNKYFSPLAWGIVGFASVCIGNWAVKRPVLSGIQKHIIVTAGLAGGGMVLDHYREKYIADRDAVLRHYVELHPEDFPPFERKQFKDIFEHWQPIR